MLGNEPIDALRLTIASPVQIRAWSSGKVMLQDDQLPDGEAVAIWAVL